MSPVSKKNMSGVAKVAAVVLVVSLGLWGCARRPVAQGSSEKFRELEGRCVKMEQAYRNEAQARARAAKELATLEEEAARLQRELAERQAQLEQKTQAAKLEREHLQKQVAHRTSERDNLQQQLAIRISERDAVTGRYENLRKGLQALVIQDDAAYQGATPPAPAEPAAGGQS
jgi:septal ring factor EnvC (AmiA/AmiB activator)